MASKWKLLYSLRNHAPNTTLSNSFYNAIILSSKRKATSVSEEDVLNCEGTIEGRTAFNQKYRALNPSLYQRYEKGLEAFRSDYPFLFKNQPDTLAEDLLFCRRAYGHCYEDYFGYDLQNKTPQERRSYLSERDLIEYAYQVNGFVARKYLHDKSLAYLKLKPYYKRDCLSVKKKSDYADFLRFLEKHPRFMEKDIRQDSGRGIRVVDVEQDQVDEQTLFQSYLEQGKIIMEELIVQEESVAKYNPDSVNTVRAVVFKTKQGVQFPFAYFRMGRKGTAIDNAAAGGVFTEVDTSTGQTITEGFYLFGDTTPVHPDTGLPLKGIQLPDWEGLIEVVTEATKEMKHLHYIGWDLAYTPKGWVIVEGNTAAHPAEQVALHRGVKDEFLAFQEQMPLKGRGR